MGFAIKDFLTSLGVTIKSNVVSGEHIPHHIDISLGAAPNLDTVVPSDVTTYSGVRAVYVFGTGVLVMEMANGSVRTLSVWDGAILPISPVKIKVGTTAAGVAVLY